MQTLSTPELAQIEANIKAGKLSEEQAKPLLLEAGLRAAGQALASERLADAGGQTPGMAPVPRR